MLRNRSKAVTTKQALMSDQMEIPLLSLSKSTSTASISSMISPRFLSKNHQEFEATLISPKSILDTKNSSPSSNPFNCVKTPSKPQTINNTCNKTETQGIGLALVDSLNQENDCKNSIIKPINRMALFTPNLKLQIPPPTATATATPRGDFGIKTGNSHLAGVSPAPDTPATARELSRQLSLKEMEQSEDYTCVIIHGPNPKTTHIFDDCIVESCNCDDSFVCDGNKIQCGFGSNDVSRSSSDSQFEDEERDSRGRNNVENDDALLDSL